MKTTFYERFEDFRHDIFPQQRLQMEPIWKAHAVLARHRRFRFFFMFVAWLRRTFFRREYNYNSAFLRYLAGYEIDLDLVNKTIVLVEPSMFRRDESYIEGPFDFPFEAILAAEDAVARHPFGEAQIVRASEEILQGERVIWPGLNIKQFTGGYRDSAEGTTG